MLDVLFLVRTSPPAQLYRHCRVLDLVRGRLADLIDGLNSDAGFILLVAAKAAPDENVTVGVEV
jgi:hypothetical protein